MWKFVGYYYRFLYTKTLEELALICISIECAILVFSYFIIGFNFIFLLKFVMLPLFEQHILSFG